MSEAVTARTRTLEAPKTDRTGAASLQRKCACGQHTIAGDECSDCRKKRRNLQRWPISREAPATALELPPSFDPGPGSYEATRFGHDLSRVPATARSEVAIEPMPLNEPEPAAPAPAMVVADEADALAPGQIRKSEFLEKVRAAVSATMDPILGRAGRSTDGCPYLQFVFRFFERQDVPYIERTLRQFALGAPEINSAADYIPYIIERARQGAERWVATGEISGLPDSVPSSLLAGAFAAGGAGASALFLKGKNGHPAMEGDPRAIQAQLGHGKSLDHSVRSRMEPVFGRSFAHVRTHTDMKAAELSNSVNARAFTLGEHVAFGGGEHHPGTIIGDALIAHELAHVVQQRSAKASVAPMQLGAAGYDALEQDADRAAEEAVASLWGSTKGTLARMRQTAMPSLKSGLRLQACRSTPSQSRQSVSPATTPAQCPPVLLSPSWEVADRPILMPRNRCELRLARPGGREGMQFSGNLRMTPNCDGMVYFVQYVHPTRNTVQCSPGNSAFGLCTTVPWGIDSAWPYPLGSNQPTLISSGIEERRIQTADSPGIRDISNPEVPKSRICLADEFVTYVVFEDANANLTPLGWMQWQWSAQAWRDSGSCPLASSSSDCSGWHVTGVGAKVSESFTPGSMHRDVPLNRSSPVVDPVALLSNARDCPEAECPLPSSGSSTP